MLHSLQLQRVGHNLGTERQVRGVPIREHEGIMVLVEASRSRALAGWVTLGLWICRGAGDWWNEGRAVFYRRRQTRQTESPGLGRSPFVSSRVKISEEEVLAPGSSSPFFLMSMLKYLN